MSDQHGPKPRIGLDRSSAQQLLSHAYQIDPEIASAYAARDEVATIPEQTDAGVGGTYTLTVTFYGTLAGESFTTESIAYDANAATIESAIDIAATSLPSWTNGDISVSQSGSSGVSDGTVSLTFDGSSVAETPALVSITPTGFTADTAVSRVAGHGDRPALQALYEMNCVAGPIPKPGDVPTLTRPASNGRSRPRRDLLLSLARLVSADDRDGDSVYHAVAALYPV